MTHSYNHPGQLWQSFRAGSREAFAHIYNQHLDTLYKYGTKLCQDEELVKDAIQEVFLDLFLKREKNRTSPDNLKYYLILALKRNLIRKIKQNRKIVGKDRINDLDFETAYSTEHLMIVQEEELTKARRISLAVGRLPSKQKEALYLRYNEALDYSEIAVILDISVESVRKQVYRAVRTIREMIGEHSVFLWVGFFSGKK